MREAERRYFGYSGGDFLRFSPSMQGRHIAPMGVTFYADESTSVEGRLFHRSTPNLTPSMLGWGVKPQTKNVKQFRNTNAPQRSIPWVILTKF